MFIDACYRSVSQRFVARPRPPHRPTGGGASSASQSTASLPPPSRRKSPTVPRIPVAFENLRRMPWAHLHTHTHTHTHTHNQPRKKQRNKETKKGREIKMAPLPSCFFGAIYLLLLLLLFAGCDTLCVCVCLCYVRILYFCFRWLFRKHRQLPLLSPPPSLLI